ncbi:MAG: thiamine phosphate synthase [Planctomycetota bacterium]
MGARGVHVGQDDLPPSAVRKVAGKGLWIGLSTHDLDQLDEAADLGADYAGFGPVFATPTKGVATGLGPDRLLGALAVARVPLVAIGGIGPENAWMIPAPAALAVSAALCGAEDPAETARRILHARN